MFAIRLVSGASGARAYAVPVRAGTTPPVPDHTVVPLSDDVARAAEVLLAAADDPARPGAVLTMPRPGRRPGLVLLVGVGDGDEAGWRAAGAALARAGHATLTVGLPHGAAAQVLRGLAEGLWLGGYRYRAGPPADRPDRVAGATAPTRVDVAVDDPRRYADTLAAARAAAAGARLARDLTNTPSSRKTPAWMAGQVRRRAGRLTGTTVTVRDRDRLAAEGFGAILAVGAASAAGPCLVELAWRPPRARTHVVLVGKGITFDTGGITVKPRDAMKLMRKDMGGAAAVLAATLAVAELGLPVRVTTLAPLAENMLGGSAFRPGDVITHYGGATSESTNSDAEGRLVVADALAYAVRRLRPDILVDFATLTGANAVALGRRTAALYSDNDDLAEALRAAGEATGERLWRMPLPADYVEYLGSEIADLYSAPERGAGSVAAALYLREFTGDVRGRWAHVDMSAPSWADEADGELSAGATGWGVRTLVRWLTQVSHG